MSTGDNAHSSSGYYMLTGRPHPPMNFENANPGAPNDAPSLGALLGQVGGGRGGLPPTITLPHRIFNTDGSVWPGQDAGFLGRSADPWLLNARLTPEGYRIQEIDLPADLDPGRLGRRMDLLDRLQHGLDALDRDPAAELLDGHTRRAFDLLRSSEARRAFRLDEEPEANRDRYGETPFGQGVLLARRLVEAGVRLVQVNWYRGADEPPANPCWDSHVDESARLKDVLVPPDRPGLLGAPGRPATARAARRDAGRLHGRVRPHPAARRQRRPGALGLGLLGRDGGGRRPRAARSTARPTRSGPIPATGGSAPRTSRPRSSIAWATARKPSTSTRSAAPTRSAGAR